MSRKMMSRKAPFHEKPVNDLQDETLFDYTDVYVEGSAPLDDENIYQLLEKNRDVFLYGAASDEDAEEKALLLVLAQDAAAVSAALASEDGIAPPDFMQDSAMICMQEDVCGPALKVKKQTVLLDEAREKCAYLENRCQNAWWGLGDMPPQNVPVPD